MNVFVCLGLILSLILALMLFVFFNIVSKLIFKEDEKEASSVSSTDYIIITSLM